MPFDEICDGRRCYGRVLLARCVLATAIAAATCTATLDVAAADRYPSKRITLVLPFGVGSPPDVFGRLVAQSLTSRLAQSVVVVNRPGAGSTIATKEVATAAPDGYTLLMVNSALAYAPLLFPNAGYDPRSSFTPIAGIASWPLLLTVNAELPVNSAQDLVAFANAKPGTVNFGHTLGSTPQILAEIFRKSTSAPINTVPYPQPPQLIADLVGRRIQGFFGSGASLISLVKDGKLKALAVTATKRHSALPEVPSVVEAGLPALAFDPSDWTGIVAPAGTSPNVVATLHAAVLESLRQQEVRDSIRVQGAEVMALPAAQFSAFVSDELARWPVRFREAGIGRN